METILLTAEKLVFEGWALARPEGLVHFIDGALPGETVEAVVTRRAKSHVFARAVRVVTPSSARRDPPCPVSGRCGGCQLLHCDYATQLEAKRGFVAEALRLVPGASAQVEPVLGMENPIHFRNKLAFSIGDTGGRAVVGFHERESADRIADAGACVLQSDESRRLTAAVRDALDAVPAPRRPRRLEVRESRATGARMAFFETGDARPPDDLLAAACRPLCTTAVVGRSRGGQPTLFGPGAIIERIDGLEFEIGPRTFFQTNTEQAGRLYGLIGGLAQAAAPRRALDLYAGVGTIAAFLARVAQEVVAVESVESSARAGAENFRRNGLERARMLRCEAGRMPASALREPFDLVVVDPPRAGLDEEAHRLLGRLAPAHLVYVSCNPATLARDLVRLIAGRRRIARIQPIDMFPHSFHVETLVHLVRA